VIAGVGPKVLTLCLSERCESQQGEQESADVAGMSETDEWGTAAEDSQNEQSDNVDCEPRAPTAENSVTAPASASALASASASADARTVADAARPTRNSNATNSTAAIGGTAVAAAAHAEDADGTDESTPPARAHADAPQRSTTPPPVIAIDW
jgi:hypothetical protein